jgi:hypothetical protein
MALPWMFMIMIIIIIIIISIIIMQFPSVPLLSRPSEAQIYLPQRTIHDTPSAHILHSM